jgi:hypothetical protein
MKSIRNRLVLGSIPQLVNKPKHLFPCTRGNLIFLIIFIILLKKRLSSINPTINSPPLTNYSPHLIMSKKYSGPTMTYSKRIDLAKPLNQNPAANNYIIKRYLES